VDHGASLWQRLPWMSPVAGQNGPFSALIAPFRTHFLERCRFSTSADPLLWSSRGMRPEGPGFCRGSRLSGRLCVQGRPFLVVLPPFFVLLKDGLVCNRPRDP